LLLFGGFLSLLQKWRTYLVVTFLGIFKLVTEMAHLFGCYFVGDFLSLLQKWHTSLVVTFWGIFKACYKNGAPLWLLLFVGFLSLLQKWCTSKFSSQSSHLRRTMEP